MGYEFDLGFLGGGQLARMSIQAAQRMGLKCLSLDPGSETPANQIAQGLVGSLDDAGRIAEVFQRSARVTLENEFIPVSAIREAFAIAHRPANVLVPGPDCLGLIQDKLLQRERLRDRGVPTPKAVPLEGDGGSAIRSIGFPMVLKARFGGYDGKGTRYARTPDELESHRSLWEAGGWLAESFVPFRRELAAMVWVDESGACGSFPTMETVQENHVCSLVFPSDADGSAVAVQAVEAFEGRGLFGVEMFELADGSIQINELAPRPHNTGHYSLDWGLPSQFDVHARLAAGYPVGSAIGGKSALPVCMANLLGRPRAGDFRVALRRLLESCPDARFHWYGKAESRPGRKMGHINVVGERGDSIVGLVERATKARDLFYAAWEAG